MIQVHSVDGMALTDSIEHTTHIQSLVERLSSGDVSAREQLIAHTWDRLLRLTRHISRDFHTVRRWEQTADIWQNASLRIWKALEKVEINDARHFLRLAAEKIRFELIDLTRHYQGTFGQARHHQTPQNADAFNGEQLGQLMAEAGQGPITPLEQTQEQDIHGIIEQLPDELKEVFDLYYYHDLPQTDIARMLQVDVRTIKRRWRSARLALQALCEQQLRSI